MVHSNNMAHTKKHAKNKSWTLSQLKDAVASSTSYRMTIQKIGLVPAGGNYVHIKRIITENEFSTDHFTGKGWNVGLKFIPKEGIKLSEILQVNRPYQSYKLKIRLFNEHLKKEECEICGWHQMSADGRIPVELDHINGDRNDNRLKNLRILCPNCHSLQLTHRGKNKKIGRMA